LFGLGQKEEKQPDGSTETVFLVRFLEWSEAWNTWVKRSSNNIRMPNTVCVPKPVSLRQLVINALTSPMPDYTGIETKVPETGCINSAPVPACIGEGSFIRIGMPKDNSCMFHMISFLCHGKPKRTVDLVMTQRLRVAESILADPEYFSEGILGSKPSKYCDTIKRLHSWGGAIELGIFSRLFQVQIVAIDISTCTVYTFPDSSDTEHKYTKRIFTVYNHEHYDCLAFLPNNADLTPTPAPTPAACTESKDPEEGAEKDNEQSETPTEPAPAQLAQDKQDALEGALQEYFHIEDTNALRLAVEHAGLLHMAFKKKFEKSVEWRGLEGMSASEGPDSPSVLRQSSDVSGRARPAPVGVPRSLDDNGPPSLNRAQSVRPMASPRKASIPKSKEAPN
jgi:hypothetical protein